MIGSSAANLTSTWSASLWSDIINRHADLDGPDEKTIQKVHRFSAKGMENPWRLQLGCRRTRQNGINRRQRMAHGSVKAGWAGVGILHLATPHNAPCQW